MATDLAQKHTAESLDLSGLPEPVVRDIRQLVETLRGKFGSSAATSPSGRPRPLRGRFADLKLSIPKEEIDEARREMWANFPREFPDPTRP
jgi:hypothetical protein